MYRVRVPSRAFVRSLKPGGEVVAGFCARNACSRPLTQLILPTRTQTSPVLFCPVDQVRGGSGPGQAHGGRRVGGWRGRLPAHAGQLLAGGVRGLREGLHEMEGMYPLYIRLVAACRSSAARNSPLTGTPHAHLNLHATSCWCVLPGPVFLVFSGLVVAAVRRVVLSCISC